MKRAFLAIFCGAALLANSIACADAVSDREWPIAIRRPRSPETVRLSFTWARSIHRESGGRGPIKRHSGGSRGAADQGHSHAMLVLCRTLCHWAGNFERQPEGLQMGLHCLGWHPGRRIPQRSAPADERSGNPDDGPSKSIRPRSTPAAGRAVRTQPKPVVPTDNVRPDSQPPPAAAASKQSPASSRHQFRRFPSVLKGRAAAA